MKPGNNQELILEGSFERLQLSLAAELVEDKLPDVLPHLRQQSRLVYQGISKRVMDYSEEEAIRNPTGSLDIANKLIDAEFNAADIVLEPKYTNDVLEALRIAQRMTRVEKFQKLGMAGLASNRRAVTKMLDNYTQARH